MCPVQSDTDLIAGHRIVHDARDRAVLNCYALPGGIDQIVHQRRGGGIPNRDAIVAAVVQLVALDDRRRSVQVNAVIGNVVDVIIKQHRWRDHELKFDAFVRIVDVVAAHDDVPPHNVNPILAHVVDDVVQHLSLAAF